MVEILSRTLIALALTGAGLLAYQTWNQWQLRRLRTAARRQAPGLEAWRPGQPGILYFTTPDCAPCRTAQRPALERLRAQLDDALQIIQVDATEQPEAAAYWGVLSVPTTFILAPDGAPRHVNHGVTGAEKLMRQLDSARQPAGPTPKVALN